MARRLTPNARAFTDEMRATMLDALAQGSTYRAACGAAGISWPTWMRWSREVRAEECDDPDVAALVIDARKTFEAANVALATSIRVASADDWKAAAWLLDHRQGDPKARHDAKRARYEAEVAKARAAGTHVERHEIATADDAALLEEARALAAALSGSDPSAPH
jgi:hypothetical protein